MNRARPSSALLVAALLGIGIVVGRLIPPLVARLDGTVPRLSWSAALTLLLGAAIVATLAWNTWQSLHKKHERMTSDHAIKLLALAKACVVVGALVAGGYTGFALAYAGAFDSPLGQERVVRGGSAAVASLLLMTAALLLERACRLPEDDEEEKGHDLKPYRGPTTS